jgi:hypothetical protein
MKIETKINKIRGQSWQLNLDRDKIKLILKIKILIKTQIK